MIALDNPSAAQAVMSRYPRLYLTIILGVYLVLAVSYGAFTPLFEASDESLHYYTIDFITRERRLPSTREPGLMGQEAAQPPLYYVVSALLTRPIINEEPVPVLWGNPRADPRDPRGENRAVPPINVNLFIHTPDEAWPWRGYVLAAHLARLLSAVFGLGTLLCIYAAGRVVWPDAPDRALLATALVAFLPQFVFLHGAITNDVAVIFFSSAAIWQLLRLLRPPAAGRERPGTIAYLLLGVTIGLALLSKAAGILLLIYVTAVLCLHTLLVSETRRWRRAVSTGLLVAVPALMFGGWVLWRNWTLYGDPTAANQFVLLAGGERPYTLRQVWNDLDRVWLSTFGIFGWMNLRPPVWVYVIWNGIVTAAVLGAAWWGVKTIRETRYEIRRNRRWEQVFFHPAVVLLGWFLLVALGWLQFMLRTPADQGRLFFPALVPMALGVAFGLSRWPRPWTQLVAVGMALVTAVYCLVAVIIPTYEPPPVIAAVPEEAIPLAVRFAEGLNLQGVTIETPVIQSGEWGWLTLYWQARPDDIPFSPLVELELFGRGFERVGQLLSYHGRGNYPATLWPGEGFIADQIGIRPSEEISGPVEGRLTVRLSEDAPRVDVGTIKIIPSFWPDRRPAVAQFGDAIELGLAELSPDTAAPGETIAIGLTWQVIAPPGPELLHVFVHLGDPTQEPLVQKDGPVMVGSSGFSEYPPRLWATGEVFEETISLVLPGNLPPGEYMVNVGVYNFATGERLPLVVDGERQPLDTLTIDRLLIR
jgi:4-amino-4-deoxy-L-arabinose transferase-like glycosyltransferase